MFSTLFDDRPSSMSICPNSSTSAVVISVTFFSPLMHATGTDPIRTLRHSKELPAQQPHPLLQLRAACRASGPLAADSTGGDRRSVQPAARPQIFAIAASNGPQLDSTSTITTYKSTNQTSRFAGISRGERRGSNPRPPGPQPGALPTELRPPRDASCKFSVESALISTRPTHGPFGERKTVAWGKAGRPRGGGPPGLQ
jgi:hypothetical protein